jgi:hypothetical protein
MTDYQDRIRHLAAEWATIQESEVALQEDDVEALKQMPHGQLALLAWRALNLIQQLEGRDFSSLINWAEYHLEGPGSYHTCWCIAQADGGNNFGGFSDFYKTVGGTVFGTEIRGDVLLYESWKAAREAFDAMYEDKPDLKLCMRIYPVLFSAGNEPRTTCPKGER